MTNEASFLTWRRDSSKTYLSLGYSGQISVEGNCVFLIPESPEQPEHVLALPEGFSSLGASHVVVDGITVSSGDDVVVGGPADNDANAATTAKAATNTFGCRAVDLAIMVLTLAPAEG